MKGGRYCRFWLPLCCGLASALGAAWFIHLYIETRLAARTDDTRYDVKEVAVVVAAQDLQAGSSLQPAELKVRTVPLKGLPSDVIVADQADSLFNRTLKTDVARGKPVQYLHLQTQREHRFSAKLQPGERAFTLAVNATEANAGLIEPGDRLDLYRITSHTTHPLVLSVPVLATGNIWKSQQRPVSDYRTITLAVSAEQISYLAQLNRRQELAFWLRGDDMESTVVWESDNTVELLVAGYGQRGRG